MDEREPEERGDGRDEAPGRGGLLRRSKRRPGLVAAIAAGVGILVGAGLVVRSMRPRPEVVVASVVEPARAPAGKPAPATAPVKPRDKAGDKRPAPKLVE